MRWGPAHCIPKTAAAFAALGISLAVGLPMPFWAMTTVYITSNPLSGATRSKSIYRVMGTTMGAPWRWPWCPRWSTGPRCSVWRWRCWVGGCLIVSLLDRPRAPM
jgi:hypothetical protein